jgi:hypothetical protein
MRAVWMAAGELAEHGRANVESTYCEYRGLMPLRFARMSDGRIHVRGPNASVIVPSDMRVRVMV